MFLSPYAQMQKAVDIVLDSPHPVNKVAATVFGEDIHGENFTISRTNYWPDIIKERIGTDIKIGNSSGTIHAETAAILASVKTADASICVTDPFCPNCAKNIAEAGITTIYIDHKGFEKDFSKRRGDHFVNMSMRICEKAGINIYEIYRKQEKLVPIYESPADFVPYEDSPVLIEEIDDVSAGRFKEWINDAQSKHYKRKFAVAFAKDADGKFYVLHCRSHPAVGYSMQYDQNEIEKDDSKYSFILQPVSRLLMNASRNGVKIIEGLIFSSVVPTSREQVNMVGAGLKSIHIAKKDKARDSYALKAMEQLSDTGIITFNTFDYENA